MINDWLADNFDSDGKITVRHDDASLGSRLFGFTVFLL